MFLAELGEPFGETRLPATESRLGAVSDTRSAVSGDPATAIPFHLTAIAAPDDETLHPWAGFAASPPTDRKVATVTDPGERTAALWQLAEHNKAQLYAVLWQALEVEEPDDVDFHEFVLATLEERGDHAPGEILAALVQSAPTSALRLNALQLLAEASQELSVSSFNQALDDPDPAIRQSAQAFFSELNANALLDAVADAVMDRNRVVRLTAFSTMEEMYQYTPVWEVANLVTNDPDPQIRMRALELLTYGDRQAAIDSLTHALNDPNPKIYELAEALLAELEQGPS
jgi:HEAT repeat protein